MSKTTYYIVQTSPVCYVHGDSALGFVEGVGICDASRLCWGKAQVVFREFAERMPEDAPRRYPRIVKVTTEYKTIKTRR